MAELAWLVRAARTFLFVPGDRPDRFPKATASGADVVVLDLEDAVAPATKNDARQAVARFLRTGQTAAVRLNGIDTPWHHADLEMLAEHDHIVMLPKTERVDEMAGVIARLSPGSAVVALMETARGVLSCTQIAEVPGVHRLALGTMDLAAELGVEPDEHAVMDPMRHRLVLASASAGLAPPIDGVTASVNDPAVLEADVRHGKRLGLTAKLCIHPAQVAVVDGLLRPLEQEVRWARAVLTAADQAAGGPVLLDGRMVDKPVVDRARRIIDAAAKQADSPERGEGHG